MKAGIWMGLTRLTTLLALHLGTIGATRNSPRTTAARIMHPLRFGFGSGTRGRQDDNPYITNGEVMPHGNYMASNASAYRTNSAYAPTSYAPALANHAPATYGPTNAPASHATASNAAASLNTSRPNRPFVRSGEQGLSLTTEPQPARRSPVVAFTGLHATTRFEAAGDGAHDHSAFDMNEFGDLRALAAFVAPREPADIDWRYSHQRLGS